jgi:hypothetical protein
MTFSQASVAHPEYGDILRAIRLLASLDRALNANEDAELASLNNQDLAWRERLGLI